MPQEMTLDFACRGFSSNSSIRLSSFMRMLPKRSRFAFGGMSRQTTVMSAFFSMWYSIILLKSILYTPSPEATNTYGS